MTEILQGKKGVIVGVANDRSIAWGIAKACARAGAEIQLTYQNDALKRRVLPLAGQLGLPDPIQLDVSDEKSTRDAFAEIGARWSTIDFLVHAVAFADRDSLRGAFIDTTRESFQSALDISAYSFVELARRAQPLMVDGGSLLTLSYLGSARTVPNYNVMGVAKAALESCVRYLAADFGPGGIRVNAISAGPIRTLAASGIGDGRRLFEYQTATAPLGRPVNIDDVGGSATYLLSDLARSVTGEIHYVDSGFNIVGVPDRNSPSET